MQQQLPKRYTQYQPSQPQWPPPHGVPPQQQWQQQPNYTQPQSYQQRPVRPPQKPPQQMPPNSHNNWLWWVGAIISCVIFISIGLSRSGLQSTSTTTNAPTVIASTASTSVLSNTLTPFTIGQQVSVGYWNVSVNSAKTSHGDEAFSPKSGTIYLVIDVTVINTSTSNQLMASGYYFRLTDSTGQPYDEQFTNFGGPPEGTIIPNGKLRGQLIYEVPTSEHAFTLQALGDNTIGAPTAVWSITD